MWERWSYKQNQIIELSSWISKASMYEWIVLVYTKNRLCVWGEGWNIKPLKEWHNWSLVGHDDDTRTKSFLRMSFY